MSDTPARSMTDRQQEVAEEGAAEDIQTDPRLDFSSPQFNAELALQTPHLQPPVPDAPVLDNVSKCAGFLPATESEPSKQDQEVQNTDEMKAKKAKAAAMKQRALQATRRAENSVKLASLPEVMSIAAVGPLAVLAKWQAAGQRIYVVTRHASGISGRAVGTLAGFDKFLNLLLKDVEEAYTVIIKVQRVKQQVIQDQGGCAVQTAQQPGEEQAVPAVSTRTRTRWCRKQEHRYRQLDQILLRGDSIVLVSGTPPPALPLLPAGVASAQAAVASKSTT